MAYDPELAERIRFLVEGEPGLGERRMFGGLAFLVHGHLALAASSRGGVLARVHPDDAAALLGVDGVEPMVMRGRAMAGWLHVPATAVAGDEELEVWARRCLEHVRTLPPK